MNGQPGSSWAFQAEGGPCLSMSILLEGKMEAAVEEGNEFRLESGQILLMAVGQHASGRDVLSAERDFRMISINLMQQALLDITGLWMEDLLKCMRESTRGAAHADVCMASMPVFSALQRVVGEISYCRYPSCRARQVFLCAKVAEAIAAVLDKCTHEQGDVHAACRAFGPPRLMQAHTLLDSKYSEAWSVELLAQAVRLTEKRLQAGSQALYSCTVHECLTRIRLDTALSMLSVGFPVTHTALAVGFAYVSHFSKVFRNSQGVSPKQWVHGRPPAN